VPELAKIFYTFKNADEKLPSSYLDYSIVRKFAVVRDSLCDDSLEHMAYTQGFDEKGHPVDHQFTLKMSKGAPKLAITRDKLPCYMLQPDGLKIPAQMSFGREPEQQPGNAGHRTDGWALDVAN
jgi:hypothetical protein